MKEYIKIPLWTIPFILALVGQIWWVSSKFTVYDGAISKMEEMVKSGKSTEHATILLIQKDIAYLKANAQGECVIP